MSLFDGVISCMHIIIYDSSYYSWLQGRTPTVLHPTQSAFTWKRDDDMPIGTYGARGIVIDDKLYVGGGDCKVTAHHSSTTSVSYTVSHFSNPGSRVGACGA